jgi:hypothetical protein
MRDTRSEEKKRHNRLFELLRQRNQAETMVTKARGFAIRKISEDEMRMLQAAAVRSLQASH